ncbi:ATP-dependent DNA helicase [Candidatus Micrarchaeota archaeon]|nr:ATP-dependent DNA helicase [Candidatus Micrarchaeota archaeon]
MVFIVEHLKYVQGIHNLMQIYFRHESVRKNQKALIADTARAVQEGKILLAHAPTGIGKTDSVLSPALSYAIENEKTVFFLTPKISQHKIAVEVIGGVAEKYELNITALDLIGRRYACIDPVLSELDHDGFYHSCEKKRRKEECIYYGKARGYSRAEEAEAGQTFKKIMKDYGAVKTHAEVVDICKKYDACPYEVMMKIGKKADVIIADYFHFLTPRIRELLLLKTGKTIENSIVIIDEAHNLAPRMRQRLSSTVNSFNMKKAEEEMVQIGAEKIRLQKFFDKWAKEKCGKNREVLVSMESFADLVKKSGYEFGELIEILEETGGQYLEITSKRSSCLKLSRFLENWVKEDKGVVRIIKNSGTYFSLSKKSLDASVLTADLNKTHASVLMSGTLEPLQMHRDILGLEREKTVMKTYESPFDKKRRLDIITKTGTTRYSKRNFETYSALAEKIGKIVEGGPKNAVVFFPSFAVMNNVVPLLNSRDVLIQRERMRPREVGDMLREFYKENRILCAVQGGSFSEGVDYKNGVIKTIVIVGIALEEMGIEIKSLIDHYQEKFGKGWEYGYIYPAIIRAHQAAGRGIRKESDKVAVVFLDERFQWKNYRHLIDRNREFIVSDEPEKYIKKFWN